ncbi:MAG: sulfatase [Kiritimatiellae bacterium]|nr:sulfatase [Kiritimatiellia bacterium]
MINRRSFLIKSLITSGATGTMLTAPIVMAAAKGKQKNILMIPVDDLKPLMGCYGNKDIITPNIDRLAGMGTIFLNNACQQAVCGPTRASLMTSRYPDSTGVWDLHTPMRSVNPDILTLPQYLIQQGYETTGIGKTYHNPGCTDGKYDIPSWSIRYNSAKVNMAKTEYGRCRGGYLNPETKKAFAAGRKSLKGEKFRSGGAQKVAMTKVGGPMTAPATECLDIDVPDSAYYDGAMTDSACTLLEKLSKGNKPFFLSVGYLKPHLPFVAPKKYWDMYKREDIKIHPFQEMAKDSPAFAYNRNYGELRSYSDIPRIAEGQLTEAQQKELIHGYRACVTYVDTQIGKLLDKVEKLGLSENTVICLWGDHGWHLGDHRQWCKHSNYEQAVRAPLMIAAPGIKGGQRCESPTGHIDVFPTLCSLVGVSIPDCVEGKDISPLMKDPKASVRKAILSQYPRSVNGASAMGYTLRSKRYRYVKWIRLDYRKGERTGLLVATELYDYAKDPLETVNLANSPEHASIVKEFENEFKERGVAQHTGVMFYEDTSEVVNGMQGVRLNGQGKYCSCKKVPASHEAFGTAHEITVFKKPERSRSDAAYKRNPGIELKAGRSYKLTFFCRSSGGAKFNAILQRNGKPFNRIGFAEVDAADSWKKIEIIGKPKNDYAIGGAVLSCHLGDKVQTVQFADVRIEELK